jgi:uncharacterized protein (DUF433 family)
MCYIVPSRMARTRTFRFPDSLLSSLQDRARARGESANALAERYVAEGIRRDSHPLIDFWDGAPGRRAMVLGTRIEVGQVVDTWLESDKSVEETAEYFNLPERYIAAALQYYAAFRAEIDEWRAQKQELADREYEAWRREQALLA